MPRMSRKRKFGKNFEVEVVVHNYNTSQTLRGMVIENLSQRGNDFREEIPNVLAVKRFLMQTVRTADSSKQTHKSEVGSREIAEWINGEVKDSVISKTRVCELTRVDKFIPKDIIEGIEVLFGQRVNPEDLIELINKSPQSEFAE